MDVQDDTREDSSDKESDDEQLVPDHVVLEDVNQVNVNTEICSDVEEDDDTQDDLRQYYNELHSEFDDDSSSDENLIDEAENNPIPEPDVPPEIEKLREWGQEIQQTDLDDLLGILRERLLPTLPKSSKTFLRTVDAKYNIIEMEDARGGVGQFVYFGIRKNLEASINPEIHTVKKLELQVTADGVPLKRSSDEQFWVLSGKVHFNPDVYDVFEIAIFYGNSKPKSADDYLEQFIEEINELQEDGIIIQGVFFEVTLKCFICDTPARAFLKCTLGHGGKEACERCEVVGERVEQRTVYPNTEARERSDHSFRSFQQAKHHHGPSPLFRIIPLINMVMIFILDFMHLCCNGAMKKLIESLYCGPIVLIGLLKPDLYDHFLLLHAASRILCCESLCKLYNNNAKIYLRSFIIALKDFYGPASQILNVHHLIHMADDVIFMNCNLSTFTAFAFESFLGKLKRMLPTPNRSLAQICRRLYERRISQSTRKVVPPVYEILSSDKNKNITKVRYKQITLTCSSPDNMIILHSGTVASIKKMYLEGEELKLECQVWQKKETTIHISL